MKRHASQGRGKPARPSQRQLRAGELVRHALVEILREETITDPDLEDVSVTVSEVRMSPDLKHAICFVEPLGGVHSPEVVEALNRHAKFLRGRLGRLIDMKFTPDLKFCTTRASTKPPACRPSLTIRVCGATSIMVMRIRRVSPAPCHPAWRSEAPKVRDPYSPIQQANAPHLGPGQPLRVFRDDTDEATLMAGDI